MKVSVLDFSKKKAGSIDLNESIFGLEERADVLQRCVRWQLAKRQAGTHKVKERGEVKASTHKIGRQKGGGTARHGSKGANIFVGGGQVHGPRVRSHAHDLPKKVRRLALKTALSSKQGRGELIILDGLTVDSPKTKELATKMKDFGKSVLIIGRGEIDENFGKAVSNLPGVDVLPSQGQMFTIFFVVELCF